MSGPPHAGADIQEGHTSQSEAGESVPELSDPDSQTTEYESAVDQFESEDLSLIDQPLGVSVGPYDKNRRYSDPSMIVGSPPKSASSPTRSAPWNQDLLSPHVFTDIRHTIQLDMREVQELAQTDLSAAYRRFSNVKETISAQTDQLETAYSQLYSKALANNTKYQELLKCHTHDKKELFKRRKALRSVLEKHGIQIDSDIGYEGEIARLQELIDRYDTTSRQLGADNARQLAMKWEDDQEINRLHERNQELQSLWNDQKQIVDKHESTILALEREISDTADYLENGLEISHNLTERLKQQTIQAVKLRLGLGDDELSETSERPRPDFGQDAEAIDGDGTLDNDDGHNPRSTSIEGLPHHNHSVNATATNTSRSANGLPMINGFPATPNLSSNLVSNADDKLRVKGLIVNNAHDMAHDASTSRNNSSGPDSWENFTISSDAPSSPGASAGNISESDDDKSGSTQDPDDDEEALRMNSRLVSLQEELGQDFSGTTIEQPSSSHQLEMQTANLHPVFGGTYRESGGQDSQIWSTPSSALDYNHQMALDIRAALETRLSRHPSSSVFLSTADTDAGVEEQLDRAIASQQACGQIHLSSKNAKKALTPRSNSTSRNSSRGSRRSNPTIPTTVPEVNESVAGDCHLNETSTTSLVPFSVDFQDATLNPTRPAFRHVSYSPSSSQSFHDVENGSVSLSPISPLSLLETKRTFVSSSTQCSQDISDVGVNLGSGGTTDHKKGHHTDAQNPSVQKLRNSVSDAHRRQYVATGAATDDRPSSPGPGKTTWKEWLKWVLARVVVWFRRMITIPYPSTLFTWLDKLRVSVSDTIKQIATTIRALPVAGITHTIVHATKSMKYSLLLMILHIILLCSSLYLACSLYQARQFWYDANTSSARSHVRSWRENRWEWTPLVYLRWYLEMYIRSQSKGYNVLLT